MVDNAWNLLASAGVGTDDIEALCIFGEGRFTEIPRADAQTVLEAIEIFTDYGDEGWIGSPTPTVGEDFGIQIWTADWIYRSRLDDGIVALDRIARTVDVLMQR